MKPLLILFALLLIGCASTSTEVVQPNIFFPRAGSVFVIQNVRFDTIRGGIEWTDTTRDSVTHTGLTYRGKKNVSRIFHSRGRYLSDTLYLAYESNGDVSIVLPQTGAYYSILRESLGSQGYFPPGSDTAHGPAYVWKPVPFGSQQAVSFSHLDTTYNIGGHDTEHVIADETGSYRGAGSFTLAGKTFGTSKVALTHDSQGEYIGKPFHYQWGDVLEWAPEIGWIVRREITDGATVYEVQTLIDYRSEP